MNEDTIFDLTDPDCIWKGVFFGEMDNKAIDEQIQCPTIFKTPKGYVVGIMALIWIDKDGIWHIRARVKFPSGSKQTIQKDFNPKEHDNLNETRLLQELYKIPIVNKQWYPNPCGTPEGIIELIQKADMVESMRITCQNEP